MKAAGRLTAPHEDMKRLSIILICSLLGLATAVASTVGTVYKPHHSQSGITKTDELKEVLSLIAAEHPTVGICVITESDTICINEDEDFAMMSVVKLYQAVAIATTLYNARETFALDVKVTRDDLPTNTWSPLAREGRPDEFWMPVEQLLAYTLQKSDNNACDVLFERISIPKETEDQIKRLDLPGRYGVEVTESDQVDWPPCDILNFCSPLSAASLIDRIFNGTIASDEMQGKIQLLLSGNKMGDDRIMKPLRDTGAIVAHKTGTGWEKDGYVTATNDVAHVILPNGDSYSLAVLISNFKGTMKEANAVVAKVSEVVYKTLASV